MHCKLLECWRPLGISISLPGNRCCTLWLYYLATSLLGLGLLLLLALLLCPKSTVNCFLVSFKAKCQTPVEITYRNPSHIRRHGPENAFQALKTLQTTTIARLLCPSMPTDNPCPAMRKMTITTSVALGIFNDTPNGPLSYSYMGPSCPR